MIAAAMLVGPGESERYLRTVLAKASEWADQIVIYEDHADNRTLGILESAEGDPAYNLHLACALPDAPSFLDDESACRNALLETLDHVTADGDLIVVLDADECLDAPVYGQERDLLEGLTDQRSAESWGVTFYHLWAPDGSVYRTDGTWRPVAGPRVYRHVPGMRVQERRLACKPVPEAALPAGATSLRVAHYGYAREPDRVAKHQRYMELDGGRYHSLVHLESIVGVPTLAPYPPAA